MKSSAGGKRNVKGVVRFIGGYIDYPTAIAGAVIMGLIVGIINRRYGLWPASTAALKQAGYTFFFGGMLIRLLYVIEGKINGKWASILFSTLIATTITIMLVYLVHSMKGTPMPLESTLPTVVMAPPGFFFLAWRRKSR